MTDESINLEFISGTLADQSKRWWGAALICQGLIVAINFFITFANVWVQPAALVAGLLAIIYTLIQWRSDSFKRTSDSVKRKSELSDGLGWPITGKEISDLLATTPKSIREKIRLPSGSAYYSSKAPKSPHRLVANVEESSWWSKHLAGSMVKGSAAISVIILALAISTMAITLESAPTQTTAENVAKVTTSVIVFLFSGGYFRLTFEYNRFAKEAENIENRADNLKKQNDVSDVEALKLLHDYQIIRAGSPLIPTWLWKMRRKDLNESWEERLRLSA